MWHNFETTIFVTKLYPQTRNVMRTWSDHIRYQSVSSKHDTICKRLLSLLKCILRQWHHLLPLAFGQGYISRLTSFITKMYPQTGFQICDEILLFLLKRANISSFLGRKVPFFEDTLRIQLAYWKSYLVINCDRVTRTRPPDGVGCRTWPDEDTKMVEFSCSKNVS